MTDEEIQKEKEYQKEYRKNMTDEQKQRYKEARNKRDKDKYHNMTDEERQRYKELNNGKIIITIIKDNDHFNDVIELQKSIIDQIYYLIKHVTTKSSAKHVDRLL